MFNKWFRVSNDRVPAFPGDFLPQEWAPLFYKPALAFLEQFRVQQLVPNLNDHGPAFSEQLLERNILHTRNFANNNFTDKELFDAFERSFHGSVKRVKNVGEFAHIFVLMLLLQRMPSRTI
jgi:hypothetical protein